MPRRERGVRRGARRSYGVLVAVAWRELFVLLTDRRRLSRDKHVEEIQYLTANISIQNIFQEKTLFKICILPGLSIALQP